ncbi:NAD(P)-dependent oxidoreductase [Dactylosporangium sp. CA-092794]|uniref:NAD(P)-dependent oxidoreductase n=1 Tax=Dactylosporangium sp. CA-092794 TaxID=3239929 RepID=UPI003D8A9365
MRVGWLGLGAMGLPMATCLVGAGHAVTGYDLDPDRLAALVAAGGAEAGSPARAAAGADVLAVMVATPAQAAGALFGAEGTDGAEGAAAALSPGAIVLIMATLGPAAVAEIAERLADRGIAVVDAPVSGGVGRATTGDLLFMVGGAPEHRAAVRPLVDAMAAKAADAGPAPGDGQRVKLVNQLLCGVHIAAAAEALAFAERIGLDPRACWETIRHGAAASFMLDDRGERMLADTHTDVRSALSIFVKDMDLVVSTAQRHEYPAPLAEAAERLYLEGARAGLGRLDDSVLIEVMRGRHDAQGR